MFKAFDTYSVRARLFPALLAVIPAFAALAMLISWSKFGLTSALATIAIGVLLFAAADIARRLGRRVEGRLDAELGGKPSIVMLRHSDDTFDASRKAQYHAFLASKLGQSAPTKEEETKNPKAADTFYERAGSWLRENTRNVKKFPVLFSENITYGYRRNLLGLKGPALLLNAATVLLCLTALYRKGAFDTEDDGTTRLLIVLAFATIHATFMVFAVSKQSVIDASRTYARQLLLSCEAFISKQDTAKRSARSSTKTQQSAP